MCGDELFRQVIGIPMGTDCAPFLANLFLYSYECEWTEKKLENKNLTFYTNLTIAFDTSTTYYASTTTKQWTML